MNKAEEILNYHLDGYKDSNDTISFLKKAKLWDIILVAMKDYAGTSPSESGAGMKEALEKIANLDFPSGHEDDPQAGPYYQGAKDYLGYAQSIARKALSSQQEQEPDLSVLEKLDDRERKSVIKYFRFLNKG